MAEEFATSRKKCVRCSTPVHAIRLDVSPAVGPQMTILLQCESITKQSKAVVCHDTVCLLGMQEKDSKIARFHRVHISTEPFVSVHKGLT